MATALRPCSLLVPSCFPSIQAHDNGLEAMGTWEIVDVPPNTRLVNSKIILRLKLDADGIPVRHKVRLIARGFTQWEGIDFEETFAPVALLSTIRALLSLAVERNWEVHQLDITMAYLNSTHNHVIYMKPPEGAVRGRAPETQVGLSRSSVTIQLCDSYCLGLGLEELVARQLSSCAVTAGGVVVYAIVGFG
ncbi:uncharacterized protein UDID_18017 [Ustilago sp. UG-2017a]|nr:uncharacterized protein UDID_18017 [Ustilago sp. UG-2017a]